MPASKAVRIRKRPRQARSTDTFNIILEAAAVTLEKEGLQGYNTNAIAARAGVSVGSLYQYFPNKDALTATLIERETSILLEEVDAAIAITDRREALLGIIAAGVAHQLRRPALARLLDFEEARLPIQRQKKRVIDQVQRAIMLCVDGYAVTAALGATQVSFDLFAILRGIADAAGERHETKGDALRRRVERAIFGYLNYDEQPAKAAKPAAARKK